MILTEFLEARIAEDEEAARACEIPAWEIVRNDNPPWVKGLGIAAMDSTWDACICVADAEHAVRHDPVRVLDECAAKRSILASLTSTAAAHADETHLGQKLVLAGMDTGLRLALQALALPYRNHPDFKEDWARG